MTILLTVYLIGSAIFAKWAGGIIARRLGV